MQQQYLRLLTKFYAKMVEGSRQSQLLSHSLERFLSYQVKQQQKMQRQRERDGSMRSGSSGSSLSGFEKVKRLFYSNHFETALLFYYCLNSIKHNQILPLLRVINQTNDRLKSARNGPGMEEKRRYGIRLAKFTEAIQFLQGRGGEGREIDWLYFEAFKEFQPEAVLAVQLMGSPAETLQSREALKNSNYAQVLRTMKVQCCLFDYTTREGKVFGEGERLFIGRRSDTFFVLTQRQYQRANSATVALVASRKNITLQQKIPSSTSLPSAKFKEQFLAEMLKLRQGYEANTATIASLFHFKDAGEGRNAEQVYQA